MSAHIRMRNSGLPEVKRIWLSRFRLRHWNEKHNSKLHFLHKSCFSDIKTFQTARQFACVPSGSTLKLCVLPAQCVCVCVFNSIPNAHSEYFLHKTRRLVFLVETTLCEVRPESLCIHWSPACHQTRSVSIPGRYVRYLVDKVVTGHVFLPSSLVFHHQYYSTDAQYSSS
jgi:hypothetical protein